MNNTSQRQSLEQQRAAAAWSAVQGVDGGKGKEFKSVASNLPADIQSNGLGQVMAFLRAKGGVEHVAAFNAVAGWIKRRLHIANTDFIEWLMKESTTDQYRHATSEAIAFATWMKRFTEARFKV